MKIQKTIEVVQPITNLEKLSSSRESLKVQLNINISQI